MTITRDKAFNVPRVDGVTRKDVAFGVGYACAEDRLGRRVKGRFAVRYCGRGSRSRCRGVLLEALRRADEQVSKAQGNADPGTWKVFSTCEPLRSGDPLPMKSTRSSSRASAA